MTPWRRPGRKSCDTGEYHGGWASHLAEGKNGWDGGLRVQRTAWRPVWLEQGGSQAVGDVERDQTKGRIMQDLIDHCEQAISQWKGKQRQLRQNPGLETIVAQTRMAPVKMVWGAHTWTCTSLNKHFLSASHIPTIVPSSRAWPESLASRLWTPLTSESNYWNWVSIETESRCFRSTLMNALSSSWPPGSWLWPKPDCPLQDVDVVTWTHSTPPAATCS